MKADERLLGPEGAGLIVGLVGIVAAVTIALALGLRAASVAPAGTLSTLACGVALIVGGPILMRRLRAVMVRHASGSR